MTSRFDVVIIGSGAGGATLAQRLAPTGKSILILERGEHLPREAENWSPKAVFIERRYRTKDHWYDKHGHPFIPNTHYWVGGNTTFYGAALMRMRAREPGSARRSRAHPGSVVVATATLDRRPERRSSGDPAHDIGACVRQVSRTPPLGNEKG